MVQQSWLNQLGTIATVQNFKKKKRKKKKRQSGSTKWHCRCTAQKHCTRIHAFIYKKKEHKSMIEKIYIYIYIEQTKSTVVFTH